MGYYINLKNISIDQYKEILKSADLLPSRSILKENLDEYFTIIKGKNIHNVDELLKSLHTKKKLQEFSERNNLSDNYLTILVREVKSYRQKPNSIKDFPNLLDETILKLEQIGVKNTLQLFDKIRTRACRMQLSKQLDINESEVLKLTKLTDLSRIRWVNHTFAFVLLEANYDTTEKVANADYKKLYETIKKLNENRKIYKGHIGLHDMKLCVAAAQDVSLEIAY